MILVLRRRSLDPVWLNDHQERFGPASKRVAAATKGLSAPARVKRINELVAQELRGMGQRRCHNLAPSNPFEWGLLWPLTTKFLDLYLRCWTESEIAKDVGVHRATVIRAIEGLMVQNGAGSEMHHPPLSLEVFNVWDFGLAADTLVFVRSLPGPRGVIRWWPSSWAGAKHSLAPLC